MKNYLINRRWPTRVAFLLALSPVTNAKQIDLNPINGSTLQDMTVSISEYRGCMDEAQRLLENKRKGKRAYKKAQSNQCHYAFSNLAQLMDEQSLKAIDHLSWQQWRKQGLGGGFTSERLLKNPSALISGVSNGTNNNTGGGVKK